MIIYLLLPLFNELDNHHKKYTPIITIFTWLLFTIIVSLSNYCNQIFIFTNRILIILIGLYLAKYHLIDKLNNKKYLILMFLLTITGIFILYNFKNINIDFIKDLYYITGIPFTLGMVLLINLIPTNKLINVLGFNNTRNVWNTNDIWF